jgi:hypothetical protein
VLESSRAREANVDVSELARARSRRVPESSRAREASVILEELFGADVEDLVALRVGRRGSDFLFADMEALPKVRRTSE